MNMVLNKISKRKWEARLNDQDYILRGTRTPHSSHIVWVTLKDDKQVGIARRSFLQVLEQAMKDAELHGSFAEAAKFLDDHITVINVFPDPPTIRLAYDADDNS